MQARRASVPANRAGWSRNHIEEVPMSSDSSRGVARRSFRSRCGTGAAAFATAFAATRAEAQSSPAPTLTRHAEDDWLDVPAAKHRSFLDATSAQGFGRGLFFGNNFFTGSQNGY